MNKVHPVTRRGRPMTRNREHILETAMNAYWHEDSITTSVNGICELAGVSKPSLYRDFGSEDGLTVAVLDRYASLALVKVGELLLSEASFSAKLEALIHFASEDRQMEAGCLFVKMRSKRSRFGVQTQAKIADIETRALQLYARFFKESFERGEWSGCISVELAVDYLHEQFGLAFTQRAAGKSSESIRELLTLSLSVLQRV